ncbi:hypothetical protein ACQUSR_26340 [Streptomyces sp. P1-3]|uniref:hypothetical protein n=1 Tax=Streptomyces sp. P1-3 TaxID=3421658 RepID=UPI003D368A67
MRRSRWSRPAAAVALIATACAVAVAAEHIAAADPSDSRPRPRDERAACNAWVRGSHATATCFNPYPEADRVQLHVECERWWDPDMDGAPVEVGPAQYVQLSQRCWKEIREAWVSHPR